MDLPVQPPTVAELQQRLGAGELREQHTLEFKERLPSSGKNQRLAATLAAMAADGGVLAIGVTDAGQVSPIPLDGARERIESIARSWRERTGSVRSRRPGGRMASRWEAAGCEE